MCVEGCTQKKEYAYAGESEGIWCKIHRPDNPLVIHIKYRTCEELGCNKQPSFNYPTFSTGRYCLDHCKTGMVNVKGKLCFIKGCTRIATHNLPGTKSGLWCKYHTPPGMICFNRLKSKKCEVEECDVCPSFLFMEDYKPRRCAKHRLDGMVSIRKKLCVSRGCVRRAAYNFPGEKPKYCIQHRSNKMIRNYRK